MNTLFGLAGKNILVTGASSGIGRAIAVESAKQGGILTITARNEENLQETLALLSGDLHSVIPADLGEETAVTALVNQLPELDGLVLNAGVVKTAPIRFVKKEDVDHMFEVNIQSSIVLIQKLLKAKKIKNGCSICFISSVATQKVTLGNALYAATKGAVNAFARALALELAPKQIRVNAIMPGFIETDILKHSAIDAEQLDIHKKKYPLGRFGTPNDVAYLSIYLLSDASQWMTGSLVTLDGGFSIA